MFLVPAAVADEPTAFEVQRPRRDPSRARIVRDHDERLAERPIELLQQVEDLFAGLGVEIAGRLIGEDQSRIGDDCAAIETRCSWPPLSWWG